jgi:hypothetical protein
MEKKVSKFVYWTPRILAILFVCFIAMFSLDEISPGKSFGEIIIGLLIHNISTFVLLIIVIVSWKYELVGGIAFLLAGIFYIVLVSRSGIYWNILISWCLIIAGPAFLIGILFFINWYKKKL